MHLVKFHSRFFFFFFFFFFCIFLSRLIFWKGICKYKIHKDNMKKIPIEGWLVYIYILGSTAQLRPWPPPQNPEAPRPTTILEDQASVFISPRGRVATHFIRLLRHTWVTVGLFLFPGHHTGTKILLPCSKMFSTEAHLELDESSSCTLTIAILWVSLVSFAVITLCVASQRVFIVVSLYFVIDLVRKRLDTPSHITRSVDETWNTVIGLNAQTGSRK
jgi:hypothetical protein